MSADTIGTLARLGLSAEALGAHPVARLRIVSGSRVVEADLPFAACGLSRFVLDAALIEQAVRQGVGVERGTAARRIDLKARRVHLSDGASLLSDTIMLATGKHDLNGAARPKAASGKDPAIGLRARLEPTVSLRAALQNVVELHTFEGGYAGLVLLEDGSANLCISIAKSQLTGSGRATDAILASLAADNPLFADRMGGVRSIGPWSSIANIPYGWRAEPDCAGIFRLGDQGAVIASLAGDGMGIALASGSMAASVWRNGGAEASKDFQAALRTRARWPLRVAGGLKWLAEHAVLHAPVFALLTISPGIASIAARATRIGLVR